MHFSSTELNRYDRHLTLPEVGLEGQQKLKQARVLVIGTGGLGSPISLYLAAAGVGHLGLVDFDVVDESNLQRQVLFTTSQVGQPKVHTAQSRLLELNPEIRVEAHETRLDSNNCMSLFKDYDIIVDGTDNFATRYLVNDACVLLQKPSVYGSIHRFQGQVSVFGSASGPCYRCLYPEPPPPDLVPSCAEGGVLGILPGVIGSLQATEAIKMILGIGRSLSGRLLTFDALNMKFREIAIPKSDCCPVCSSEPKITELIDYKEFCGVGVQNSELVVSADEFRQQWESGRRPLLIDVREPHEWEANNLDQFGARLIPLSTLKDKVQEFDVHQDLVVHCKSGGRSRKAQTQLLEAGFTQVRNLSGGIEAF